MQRLTLSSLNTARSSCQLLPRQALKNHGNRSIAFMSSNSPGSNQNWSGSMSFASPDTDFTGTRSISSSSDDVPEREWSHTLSFTSPESDFASLTGQERKTRSILSDLKVQHVLRDATSEKEWSQTMSFASPESDFCSSAASTVSAASTEELETARAKEEFFDHFQSKQEHHDMAYSFSHSSENDFRNPIFTSMLNDRMQDQLGNTRPIQETTSSLSARVNPRELSPIPGKKDFATIVTEEVFAPIFSRSKVFHEGPLPHNLADASLPDDPRAIVITEAQMPFRIISVNDTWENLCGYSQNECRGKSLDCIQGPETNKSAITALIAQLLKGEEAGTLMTNYTKEGRKFHNRLRVGPLKNTGGKITHFVGVLKEVNELGEHFDGEMMHA
mmetsp:Transcript_24778/g.36713  ORF Transcript_24778/g.36713 Transcript_24778/m.36713 type:complete len:388 (-) Transcript_24778:122-1285(-)